jgi:hypothetical protein
MFRREEKGAFSLFFSSEHLTSGGLGAGARFQRSLPSYPQMINFMISKTIKKPPPAFGEGL